MAMVHMVVHTRWELRLSMLRMGMRMPYLTSTHMQVTHLTLFLFMQRFSFLSLRLSELHFMVGLYYCGFNFFFKESFCIFTLLYKVVLIFRISFHCCVQISSQEDNLDLLYFHLYQESTNVKGHFKGFEIIFHLVYPSGNIVGQ